MTTATHDQEIIAIRAVVAAAETHQSDADGFTQRSGRTSLWSTSAAVECSAGMTSTRP
jgi:hypothetical protein